MKGNWWYYYGPFASLCGTLICTLLIILLIAGIGMTFPDAACPTMVLYAALFVGNMLFWIWLGDKV